MKFGFLIVFFLCILGSGLWAQSTAEEIDMLFSTNEVTYGQATRFILEASGAMTTRDNEEAFRFAADKNWLPPRTQPNQKARLDGISLLIMKSFDLKGGFMYYNRQNARYAYRELVYMGYIQGRADPELPVSGERLIFLTGRAIYDRDSKAQTAQGRNR